MPGQLENRLSGLLNSTAIDEIYGDITLAVQYPQGSAEHKGIVDAYTYVMNRLLIGAVVTAIMPVIASFFIENMKLDDRQNLVEGTQDAGLPVEVQDGKIAHEK
jgi:hypothetical protein